MTQLSISRIKWWIPLHSNDTNFTIMILFYILILILLILITQFPINCIHFLPYQLSLHNFSHSFLPKRPFLFCTFLLIIHSYRFPQSHDSFVSPNRSLLPCLSYLPTLRLDFVRSTLPGQPPISLFSFFLLSAWAHDVEVSIVEMKCYFISYLFFQKSLKFIQSLWLRWLDGSFWLLQNSVRGNNSSNFPVGI